ncbi:MAG: arsenite methyltransferase, partial [Candidatus Hodarchaeales archaeon]
KELPDFIKNSINAYIACISGAILREEYIGAIKAAGFQDVNIIGETVFPAEFVTNDPTVKKFIEELNIPLETVKDVIGSAVSVKVNGIKPNKTA